MKKTVIFSALMLSRVIANAQDYDGRVGINTETPRATLEVATKDKTKAQGILFPEVTETEKNTWTKDSKKGLVAGTVVWNKNKECLDVFNGTSWTCSDGTKSTEHGTTYKWTYTAVWGDDSTERISVSKQCTSGTGTSYSYPLEESQWFSYTQTSEISLDDAKHKAEEVMNSATSMQQRQSTAQDYANTNGSCLSNRWKCTYKVEQRIEGLVSSNIENWWCTSDAPMPNTIRTKWYYGYYNEDKTGVVHDWSKAEQWERCNPRKEYSDEYGEQTVCGVCSQSYKTTFTSCERQ